MRLILNVLVVVLVLGSLQSCVSKKKYDELLASKEATDAALAETQSQVKNLEETNAQLEQTMNEQKETMEGQIAELRDDLNATKTQVDEVSKKLQMTEEELAMVKDEINSIFGSYKDSGLSLEERDGRLYVVTDPGLAYRSGSYSLSSDERSALEELASTLKNNPALSILVEGHTDDQTVKAGASFQDNWELSSKRALSVVRTLVKNGVDPSQVAAVGRGDAMPVGDNETSEGRSENRRTVIMPNPDLSKVINNN